MTIGTKQSLSGHAKTLTMNVMGHTIAGRREYNAELGGAGLEETVVVGVPGVRLYNVVIHVTDGDGRFDAIEPQ